MESILGDLILWLANLQRFIREYFPWIYFSAQFKLGVFPTYPFEYSPEEKYIQTFLCKRLFAVLNQLIFLFHLSVLCLSLRHYYWFLHLLCTYYWGGEQISYCLSISGYNLYIKNTLKISTVIPSLKTVQPRKKWASASINFHGQSSSFSVHV